MKRKEDQVHKEARADSIMLLSDVAVRDVDGGYRKYTGRVVAPMSCGGSAPVTDSARWASSSAERMRISS
jgi:hypothetical protein